QQVKWYEILLRSIPYYAVLPRTSPQLVTSMFILSDLFQYPSMFYAISFFIHFGLKLIKIYMSFGNALEGLWYTPKDKFYSATIQFSEFHGHLDLIQASVKEFNAICGLNLFFIIFTHTMAIVSHLYGLSQEGAAFGATGALSCIFLVILIANFGHFFETQLESVRERVKRAAIYPEEKSFHFSNKSLTELTNWFLDCKFKLTAKGIHDLNHSVIPMVISSTISYIIFIFQLQNDEKPK
ncbi:unnamed protein product, partial [Allacma fusca]